MATSVSSWAFCIIMFILCIKNDIFNEKFEDTNEQEQFRVINLCI